MARNITHDRGSTEVEVFLDTAGRLDLADVGRFLQRLDTIAKRASGNTRRAQIEIVELELGSLRIRLATTLAAASLAVDGTQLAVDIAKGLRSDPPAARATLALIEGSPGAKVYVSGSGIAAPPIAIDDVRRAADSVPPRIPSWRQDVETLSGPQSGYIRHVNGEDYVELDARPNLLIRVRDERQDYTRLESGMRYTFDGDAQIGSRGRPSYFILNQAFRIG